MCRLCVNVYQDFVGISLDWMLVEDRAVPPGGVYHPPKKSKKRGPNLRKGSPGKPGKLSV
jgi:hypothetical protein